MQVTRQHLVQIAQLHLVRYLVEPVAVIEAEKDLLRVADAALELLDGLNPLDVEAR